MPVDHRALLELIGDTHALAALDEWRHVLLDALLRAVPSEWASLNELGPQPGAAAVVANRPIPAELLATFARLAHQNPLVEHYARTHDGRATRFSDLVSPAELHAREIYAEVYAPIGVEHQIAFTLPAGPDRILGVALSRGARDFSDDERDLLEAARPFLIQSYRNVLAHDATRAAPRGAVLEALGLTPRQAQVLELLAAGASDAEIAARLEISPRTVHKHLELAYRRLGVRSRAQALRIAWTGPPGQADAPA